MGAVALFCRPEQRAGLSSAAGMLLGTGLILNWLIRHNHRSELGIHFAGIGIGIAGCAVAVAAMSHWLDWREQWFAFTVMGCLLLVPALRWLPPPDNSGLTKSGQKMVDKPPSALFMRIFMAAYFCAGIGYVISATFIVAIVDRLPGLGGQGTLVFMAIGIAATPACFNWDLIARRTGDLNALILAAVLQIVGILLPVMAGGLFAAVFGALLFGGTFIGMVSLVLTMAGRYYPTRPAKMMGKMTLSYGAAQIIGPAVTGWLAARLLAGRPARQLRSRPVPGGRGDADRRPAADAAQGGGKTRRGAGARIGYARLTDAARSKHPWPRRHLHAAAEPQLCAETYARPVRQVIRLEFAAVKARDHPGHVQAEAEMGVAGRATGTGAHHRFEQAPFEFGRQ